MGVEENKASRVEKNSQEELQKQEKREQNWRQSEIEKKMFGTELV